MSATASLEALINVLLIAHNTPLRAQLPDFESSFWGKGGIERKPGSMMPALLCGRALKRSFRRFAKCRGQSKSG